MKKNTSIYTVEREFLDKISTRELIIRIIKSHLMNNEYENTEHEQTKKSVE